LSFDEEIGCIGVRRLIDSLAQAPLRPKYCIIGEPTSMQLKIAHKPSEFVEIEQLRRCDESLNQLVNAISK
jgi:acetylornithine deacetylase